MRMHRTNITLVSLTNQEYLVIYPLREKMKNLLKNAKIQLVFKTLTGILESIETKVLEQRLFRDVLLYLFIGI